MGLIEIMYDSLVKVSAFLLALAPIVIISVWIGYKWGKRDAPKSKKKRRIWFWNK